MAKKANGKFYGTGRRKSSIARVYLVPGTGNITINKRDIDEYLGLGCCTSAIGCYRDRRKI